MTKRRIDSRVSKRRTLGRIIEKAWDEVKKGYEESYQHFVDGTLNKGPYKVYLGHAITNKEKLDWSQNVFPYMTEDDVVLSLAYHIREIARKEKLDILIHGQKVIKVRTQTGGEKRKIPYRPDLVVMQLKNSTKTDKHPRFMIAAIEIKFIQSYRARPKKDYGWIKRDVKKLRDFVNRKGSGTDRGYFFCIDESCGAVEPVRRRRERFAKSDCIGLYPAYPVYGKHFGIAWKILSRPVAHRKMLYLKSAIASELGVYFAAPTVQITSEKGATRTVAKSRRGSRFFSSLVIKQPEDSRGGRSHLVVSITPKKRGKRFQVPKPMEFSLNKLSTPKQIDKAAMKFRKKFEKWAEKAG